MTEFVLGLDLGTSSIGWAVIDEANRQILWTKDKTPTPGCGVRHFQEPIDQKKNVPNNKRRREKRGGRRLLYRRSSRRRALIRELQRSGLYPVNADERTLLDKALEDATGNPPQLKLYALRIRALDQPITAFEFGRILIHLNQRRGFKSNRKSGDVVLDLPIDGKPEEKKTKRKQKKSPLYEAVKGFRQHMTGEQSRTLGEHMYRIGMGQISLPQKIRQEGKAVTIGANQIRGRFILRAMVEEEFDKLWDEQEKYLEQLRNDEIRERIRAIIFSQRDLKSSQKLIGRCECIPKLPRCPRSDWHAQQFRIYKEVGFPTNGGRDGGRHNGCPKERTCHDGSTRGSSRFQR